MVISGRLWSSYSRAGGGRESKQQETIPAHLANLLFRGVTGCTPTPLGDLLASYAKGVLLRLDARVYAGRLSECCDPWGRGKRWLPHSNTQNAFVPACSVCCDVSMHLGDPQECAADRSAAPWSPPTLPIIRHEGLKVQSALLHPTFALVNRFKPQYVCLACI